jgi:prepilin-type N-terminal cleavage/methylation domain-containing protein
LTSLLISRILNLLLRTMNLLHAIRNSLIAIRKSIGSTCDLPCRQAGIKNKELRMKQKIKFIIHHSPPAIAFAKRWRAGSFIIHPERGFTTFSSHERGFTLIEILIVTAIISILGVSSIVFFNPLEQIERTRDAQRKHDLGQIQNALEAYYVDNGRYPAATVDNEISFASWGEGWNPYIARLPKDPDSPSQSYFYQVADDGAWYRLYAKLERCEDPDVLPGVIKSDCEAGAYEYNYGVSVYDVALAPPEQTPIPIIFLTSTPSPEPFVSPTPTPIVPKENSIVIADSEGNVGEYSSIVVRSGFPVISYFDATNADLKVMRCGRPDCSSDNTITAVDTLNSTGQYTSMALGANSMPVISYNYVSGQDLRVVRCSNSACSSGNTITNIDLTGSTGQYTSIAIGSDSLPITSYYGRGKLNIIKCGDSTCSLGNELTVGDTSSNVGQYSSIKVPPDGLPVVSYYDSGTRDLKILKCGNSSCSSGNTITVVDSAGSTGQYTSIAIGSDGFPVVAYYDSTNADLKILKCGNSSCSSGNIITVVDAAGNVGQHTSIAVPPDGLPVVAYYDVASTDLKILKCGNSSCSSENTIVFGDSTLDNVGQYTSIAIGSDGLPIVSYYDQTNADLKVLKCEDAFCGGTPPPPGSTPIVTPTPTPTPATPYIFSPISGSILAGSTATFQWKANGYNVRNWSLLIGTTGVGSSNILNQNQGTNTSKTVSNLPTTGIIYVRLLYALPTGYLGALQWSAVNHQYSASPNPTPTPTPPPGSTPTPTLTATASFKRVFATSTFYNGNLGGLSGADAKCQERAGTASLGGIWKAWLSIQGADAALRLFHSTVPYMLVDGVTIIANDWDDLVGITSTSSTFDGYDTIVTSFYLRNPINKNEFGQNVSGSAWTATNTNGSYNGANCSNWTSLSGNAIVGIVGQTKSLWTYRTQVRTGGDNTIVSFPSSCQSLNRLYCFEQ